MIQPSSSDSQPNQSSVSSDSGSRLAVSPTPSQGGSSPGSNPSQSQSEVMANVQVAEVAPAVPEMPLSPRDRLGYEKWSFKAKATAWAVAASVVPVLVTGIVISHLSSQSATQKVSQVQQSSSSDTKTALQKLQTSLKQPQLALWVGTTVLAVLTGAIAAVLANLATRPIRSASDTSTSIVTRLRPDETRANLNQPDELVALESNLNTITELLPELLLKQETEAERSQVLMTVTRRIQGSRSEEEVLKTTVAEVRSTFRLDRVGIFRFNANWDGVFVEESVAPGLPKALWATISDPCFKDGYVNQYRVGRVRAIDDIYHAGLTDCHIGILERFAVKANIVAPILKNGELFGLLIGHQCSRTRVWQQSDVDLFAQMAAQVGFALDYAKLLEEVDTRATKAQALVDTTRRIRESLNEEDVLRSTVEEVRKTLNTDRVIVYSFDVHWNGTVIAESVVPGFPKALQAKIKDPCFAEGYVLSYKAGRVQATNNIREAKLTACHINQLEAFEVKANLVAPILKDDQLFGLLIAHQCSAPRDWKPVEIDLFAQVATQVSYALDHARLLQRIDEQGSKAQMLLDITRRIRESLNEENVLRNTVEEVRKAMSADRVIVYSFDPDWEGTVVAESVVPIYPKALRAKIKDPCFVENHAAEYQAGRVQATSNIYKAGLTACHINQLEAFEIKANLVAPILKDSQLFGLLIAHQCSGPRIWQPAEISLFTQVAAQVGYALDHARLLVQIDQAYQMADTASTDQRQQKEALQSQISSNLQESKEVFTALSTESVRQMESVSGIYNSIQTLGDRVRGMLNVVGQAENQEQQLTQSIQDGQEVVNETLNNLSTIRETTTSATEKLQSLDEATRLLAQIVNLMNHRVSQIKLQAISSRLEAVSIGEAGQASVAAAEKVIDLAKELEDNLSEIKPLAATIQVEAQETAFVVKTGVDQATAGNRLAENMQQKLSQVATLNTQLQTLLTQLAQQTSSQEQTSTTASQSIVEVATMASQIAKQTVAVTGFFAKLETLVGMKT